MGLMSLWVGQGCTPKKALPPLPSAVVVLDSNLTSESLNDRVVVSTKLAAKDLNRKDLHEWMSRNSVKVSKKKEVIFLGSFRQYPHAWFCTQLINHDKVSKQLIVYEYNRLRCDGFEVFTTKNGKINKCGSLDRSTPFANYPLPFFTYAIPLTIQPKDTLHLVIHTQRRFGVHEVNLNIATTENYLSTHFAIFLTRVFQITIFLILAIITLILGRVFRYRSMTYWGLYILGVVCVHITAWGFADSITNFSNIGLSGSNVSTFGMMMACVSPQLFMMEWMKPIPKNEKVFKAISYSLFGMSSFFTVCYLFPKPLFDLIDDTVNLSLVMIALVFLSIFWVFYYSFLAWIRVKIYYLFIGFVIAYAPFVLSQTAIFKNNSFIILKSDDFNILCITIGLAIVGVYLLREQLVTRKKLEENLSQLQLSLENIRKNEVETIGRNLHDNVGNMLASVLGYLNLKNQNQDTIKNLVNESINEVRFLSHTLVKQDNLPITDKLEMLVSRFNDFSPIRLYFNDYSLGKLNKIEALRQQNLYMIVQEALTNVVKHSKATQAYIQVFDQDGQLQVTIEDDGIGMGSGVVEEGIGLKNMYKRAELSAFKVTLDSNASGTNIIIEVHENKNDYRR
jgi:signal transduction histidine kinase